MTEVDTTLVPAVDRIRRRLVTQHARWLLSQPTKPWCFDIQRRWCRAWRRMRIWIQRHVINKFLIGLLLFIAFLVPICLIVLLISAVLVLPSVMLMLPPGGVSYASFADQTSVAMLRMTLIPSALIAVYLLRCPGANRLSWSKNENSNARQRATFIRRTKYRRPPILVSKWVIGVCTALAVVGIAGVLMPLPLGWVALPAVVAAICSVGWLIWRTGLRLMRYQAQPIGPLTFWEYLIIPVAAIGLLSTASLLSPAEIPAARHLVWLGPLGFLFSQIHSLAMGDLFSLVPIVAITGVCGGLGWIIASDASTWHNRRKLITSQRRRLIVGPGRQRTQSPMTTAELQQQIRRDLDGTVRPRCYRSWCYWLTPLWWRRRWGWYVFVGGIVILFQLALLPIQRLIATAEPIAVIGAAPPVSPETLIASLLVIGIALVLSSIEVAPLYDRLLAAPRAWAQRAMSPLRCWYDSQAEGLLRMPMQAVLLTPFVMVAWLGGVDVVFGWDALLIAVGFLVLVRSLFATEIISMSYLAVVPWWAMLPVKGILMLSLYALLFMPMGLSVMLLQFRFAIEALCVGLGIANLVALAMFLFVCQFADPNRSSQVSSEG